MKSTINYIQEKAAQVNQALHQVIEEMTGVPPLLKESMAYSLLAGGKRIRPVLVMATVESLGGDVKRAMPFACAIEMIHTYSLIHDDLPSMDNDDYRRGKLTNHRKFGEDIAILAGDALMTEAFGLMATGAKEAGISSEVALQMIAEGVKATGARGMVAGQIYDLQAENQAVSLEHLKRIHRLKTGKLIAYSVRTGAYIMNASPRVMETLTQFAYGLGLAFQIQDDILDVIGDQQKLGKKTGSDQEKNKATYPVLLGLEGAKRELADCIEQTKRRIANVPEIQSYRLLEIADYLLSRDQ